MNLDDLTIGDAKKLAGIFGNANTREDANYGYNVVVLDRGFVYVGKCARVGDCLLMDQGRNIRYWGTDKGLHQLVVNGPTKDSQIDAPAHIRIPWRAVISIHATNESLWTK
jgi:hypothetical protein